MKGFTAPCYQTMLVPEDRDDLLMSPQGPPVGEECPGNVNLSSVDCSEELLASVYPKRQIPSKACCLSMSASVSVHRFGSLL